MRCIVAVAFVASLLAGCAAPAAPLTPPGGPMSLAASAAACNEDRDAPRELVVEARLLDARGNDTRSDGQLGLTVEKSSELGWKYVGSAHQDIQRGDFHALPGLTYLSYIFDDKDIPGTGDYRVQVAFTSLAGALRATTNTARYDTDPATTWVCS